MKKFSRIKKAQVRAEQRALLCPHMTMRSHVAKCMHEIAKRQKLFEALPVLTPEQQKQKDDDEAYMVKLAEFSVEEQAAKATADCTVHESPWEHVGVVVDVSGGVETSTGKRGRGEEDGGADKRIKTGCITDFVQRKMKDDRGKRFIRYLNRVCGVSIPDPEAYDKFVDDQIDFLTCTNCKNPEPLGLIFDASAATLSCPKCGAQREAPPGSYVHNTAEIYTHFHIVKKCHYDRKNHLSAWLNQIQGVESKRVDEDLVEEVRMEWKKTRLPQECISPQYVRAWLKRLGKPNFYKHCVQIARRLNRELELPQLTVAQEAWIIATFSQVEKVYDQYKPRTKKNMLNYSYVLRKLLHMLELYDIAKRIPPLKSRAKEMEYEVTWRVICKALDFTYETLPLE